jgi:hypothetical protein
LNRGFFAIKVLTRSYRLKNTVLLLIAAFAATSLFVIGCSDADSGSDIGTQGTNLNWCGTVYSDAETCGFGDASAVAGVACPSGSNAECVAVLPEGGCFNIGRECSPQPPAYLFETCPNSLSGEDYQLIASKLVTDPDAQLCPDPNGCGYNRLSGDGYPECIGWSGNEGCKASGIDQFVTEFLGKGGVPAACAVVTATMAHESGFGEVSRSWDFACSNAAGDHGAVGIFQYDFSSGIRPVPVSAAAQHTEFASTGSGAPEGSNPLTMWAACNPAIVDGGRPFSAEEYAVAVTACQQQVTVTEEEMRVACNSYCPNNQNCPNPAPAQ